MNQMEVFILMLQNIKQKVLLILNLNLFLKMIKINFKMVKDQVKLIKKMKKEIQEILLYGKIVNLRSPSGKVLGAMVALVGILNVLQWLIVY